MKNPWRIGRLLGACLAVAGTAIAAPSPCSLHPKKGASSDELKAMAKITEADARKAALSTLPDPAAGTIQGAELEAERGCLVYSFDVFVSGRSGIQEIQVDAGNGKVLSSVHESPKAEAAEKARDKAKP